MPSVKVRPDEPFDAVLRRFRRACEKAMYFEHGKLLDFDNVETIIRTMKRAQQQQTRGGQGRRRNQQSA